MNLVLKKIGLSLLILTYIESNASELYTEVTPQTKLINDTNLHIFLCGTGQPEIDMQILRKPSCLAVVGRGEFAIFDAGEGSSQTLAALGLPVSQIKTIFISHLHADHIGGLGPLLINGWDNDETRSMPISIYGPWGLQDVIQGINAVYKPEIYYALAQNGNLDPALAIPTPHIIDAGPINAITKNNVLVYRSKNFSVSAYTADHRPATPALSYKIKFLGCHILISGDTNLSKTYLDNMKNLDLLISDSINIEMLKTAGNEKASLYTHYHPETIALAQAAAEEQVKNLVLTHIQPAIPNEEEAIHLYTKGMQQYYHNQLHVAEDGDQIIISPSCRITYIQTSAKNNYSGIKLK